MVGRVIRAIEAPISLSIDVARRSAVLAGRVAGWAVAGIVRELSPNKGHEPPMEQERPTPASAATPLAPEAARDEEATAATGEPAPPIDQEQHIAPTDEEKAETAPSGDREPATAPLGEPAPPVDGGPSGDREPATAPLGEPAAPVDDGEAAAVPPVGGEDGAVVEHEPGIGTSVRARSPHSALNNPVTEPDMTEWPDPYDHREDPRDPGDEMVFGGEGRHTQTGATSTSEPHPSHDPEAEPWEGPKRDKVDE